MYPELLIPLIVLVGAAAGVVMFIAVFRPVLRRLAVRQVGRRPAETVLVIIGSLLGTALIVASLTVGDSFNRSVRDAAYQTLGPVDEEVRTPTAAMGAGAASRLAPLASDPRVDGVLTAHVTAASAVRVASGTAQPRTLVWDLSFGEAARFGAPDPSGLRAANPGPGGAVINDVLANKLGAHVGDQITLHMYGTSIPVLVSEVVPARGLAGVGLGGTNNADMFVSPGTLSNAAAGRSVTTVTFVSNRGGVESGVSLTTPVTNSIRSALGPLTAQGAQVEKPKRDMLDAATATGDQLGSLFLFIASFSIIAGILLIVNVFVMLIEERTTQLGILRAVGMRRRRVAGALAVEGSIYSIAATVAGGLLGVAVGRVVVFLTINLINSFNAQENKLAVTFAATPVSVANGMLAGFLISFLAVVATSIRISRTNIIAAIRDQQRSPRQRTRRRLTIASAVVTGLLIVASVPVVANGRGAMTYLVPGLAIVAAIPLLRRVLSPRIAYSIVGAMLLTWGLVAHLVRPHIFAEVSTVTYVVVGCMLTLGAILLVSENQSIVLAPLRPLIERPTPSGLAARLAVAYPTAKRFRTGATLAMYCIVVFVIVLLTQISAIIDAGVNRSIAEATAGWTLRADYNASTPVPGRARALMQGSGGAIAAADNLVTAPAIGNDPLHRSDRPLPVLAIGIPDQLTTSAPTISKRLAGLPSNDAVWRLVASDPRYALIDGFYGSAGGPQGEPIPPGTTLTLTDPATGKQVMRIVAGVMSSGQSFYGVSSGEFRYPVLMSPASVRSAFGIAAMPTSVLIRTAAGTDLNRLAAHLQGQYVRNGLVVTDLAQAVRDQVASSRQFFQLMQGFLGLGLLVGISGLGVIMVRAVRERRRTIAMLRAMGFSARTVRRSFVAETALIAAEGVIIGTGLGVLLTWLLYQNSPTFGDLNAAYPIAWRTIAVIAVVTLLASLLVTLAPARRAAHIKPAVALRTAD